MAGWAFRWITAMPAQLRQRSVLLLELMALRHQLSVCSERKSGDAALLRAAVGLSFAKRLGWANRRDSPCICVSLEKAQGKSRYNLGRAVRRCAATQRKSLRECASAKPASS
jgi:hypothetical protein